MADAKLGPFVLGEKLGAGGMGVVWSANHAGTGRPAAVKGLKSGGNAMDAEDFQREVRVVSRLHHPGIVSVYDFGLVPDPSPTDALSSGDPWLAMELASHGSLSPGRVNDWGSLRAVLLAILDALAHAHARGVIHRDLKPANVLVCDAPDRPAVVKLTDFGIAHRRRESLSKSEEIHTGPIAGTPQYMAPEQLRGDWRDYGPWTDLYALGCLAYRLATGRFAFDGPNIFMIANKQLNEPCPPLRAKFPVSPGFEGWVQRLTAKDRRERFGRAADAAWVLRDLTPPTERPAQVLEEADSGEVEPTLTQLGDLPFDETVPQTLTLDATAPMEALVEATSVHGWTAAMPEIIAPIPESWRGLQPSRGTTMSDVGLGLVGFREPGFVGRDDLRDELWRLFRASRIDGRPRVALLRGPAGAGKSRLAEWMCERAHEVGGAEVVRAYHDPTQVRGSGLLGAVERWLELEELGRPELYKRARTLLRGRANEPDHIAAALAAVLRPAREDEPSSPVPLARFASATERWFALRNALAALAGRRTVVLWVDDAQWGGESLEALEILTRSGTDFSCFAMVTVRDEAVDESLSERLGRLGDRVSTLPVEPLEGDSLTAFVASMLPLSFRAAEVLCVRSEGYPLFAAQLLGDWVDRGILVAGTDGFELSDEQPEVPADIASLWRQRVDSLAAGARSGEATIRSLEVAAALGREIDLTQWRECCAELDLRIPVGLADELHRRGLVRPRRDGFAFAHGLLVEAIAARARDEGRWAGVHAACAAVVARAPDHRGKALRLTQHYLEVPAPDAAAHHALEALRECWGLDEATFERALDLAARAAALLEEATHPSALEIDLWRTRFHRIRWRFDDVRKQARELLDAASIRDLPSIRAEALLELGLAEGYGSGELGRALPHFEEAASLFAAEEADDRRAEVLSRMAYVFAATGRAGEAQAAADEALATFRRCGDFEGVVRALVARANTADVATEAEAMRGALTEALQLARREGFRYWEANATYGLGRIEEQERRWGAAAKSYAASAAICAEIGSTAIDAARINLALVHIVRGSWDPARSILNEIRDRGTLPQLRRSALPGLWAVSVYEGREDADDLRAEIDADPGEWPAAAAQVLAMDHHS